MSHRSIHNDDDDDNGDQSNGRIDENEEFYLNGGVECIQYHQVCFIYLLNLN